MSYNSGYEHSTTAGDAAYGYPMGEQQANVSLFKTGPQMAESIVAAQQRGDVAFTSVGGNQPVLATIDVHPFAKPIAEYYDGSSVLQKLHAVAHIPGRVDAQTGHAHPGEHYGIVGTYDTTSQTSGLLLVRFPKKEGDIVATSNSHLDPTAEVRPSRLIGNVQITFDAEKNHVVVVSHDGRPCTIATPTKNGNLLNMSETGDAWTLAGLGQAAKPERIAERRADKERAMQADAAMEHQVMEWRAEALRMKWLLNLVVKFDPKEWPNSQGAYVGELSEPENEVTVQIPLPLQRQTPQDELWLPPELPADPTPAGYRESFQAYAYSNERPLPRRRHRSLAQRILARIGLKRPAYL